MKRILSLDKNGNEYFGEYLNNIFMEKVYKVQIKIMLMKKWRCRI